MSPDEYRRLLDLLHRWSNPSAWKSLRRLQEDLERELVNVSELYALARTFRAKESESEGMVGPAEARSSAEQTRELARGVEGNVRVLEGVIAGHWAEVREAATLFAALAPEAMGLWPPARQLTPSDVPAFAAQVADLRIVALARGAGVRAEDPPTPYADLLVYARNEMKGHERNVVELLCAAGGALPLPDLAVRLAWSAPWDDTFNSLRKRVNVKLRRGGLPWSLSRRDNAARLVATPDNGGRGEGTKKS